MWQVLHIANYSTPTPGLCLVSGPMLPCLTQQYATKNTVCGSPVVMIIFSPTVHHESDDVAGE